AIKEGRPFDSIENEKLPAGKEENRNTLTTRTSTITENTSSIQPKIGSAKNGSAKGIGTKKDPKPGVVEVQRAIVAPPSEAQQAEPVIIKKKSKCNCCVIQ
ncbi:hypothetical protein BIW11_05789, partial [Tropilaelaps mercedesae]